VAHLAKGQLSLVNQQKPLAQAIADEADPTRRALLAEVPVVTRFAERVVAMDRTESYVGYYALERPWLTLVLSSAPRDRLEPHTRWYPFAGRVPYRSFFDAGRAQEEKARLEAAGYDTYLHESPAYSTLGFFRDPVTTPMLETRFGCTGLVPSGRVDPCRIAQLAETLLHELTHYHRYVPGNTELNEQLASFVARKAVVQYLSFRGLYDEPLRQRLQDLYARQAQFAQAVSVAAEELRALYASDASHAQKLAARVPIFERLTQVGLALFPGSERDDFEMNNARVLQYLRYDRHSDALEALWQAAEGYWPSFWARVDRMLREAT
jgi:predicted aminopeptidase